MSTSILLYHPHILLSNPPLAGDAFVDKGLAIGVKCIYLGRYTTIEISVPCIMLFDSINSFTLSFD
jgi:hypothetical protein